MPLLARRAASATERTLVYFRMTMYMRPPMRLSPSPRIKAYRAAAGLGPTSEMGPEAMGTAAKVWHRCRCAKTDGGAPMTQVDDLSRSLITFEQNSTMVVVLE